jgi:glycosyltransferase involved in cell wall biosynthesis
MPTQKDVAKIIKMSDCGIYPSRAEGWNNEAIETMAMNKPIIITDYSAHTEYCNKQNSYLLDIKNTEIAEDGVFFNGYGNWADIDDCIDQCVEYMREVYKNNIRTNITGVETAQKFNWTQTCNIIQNKIYE